MAATAVMRYPLCAPLPSALDPAATTADARDATEVGTTARARVTEAAEAEDHADDAESSTWVAGRTSGADSDGLAIRTATTRRRRAEKKVAGRRAANGDGLERREGGTDGGGDTHVILPWELVADLSETATCVGFRGGGV